MIWESTSKSEKLWKVWNGNPVEWLMFFYSCFECSIYYKKRPWVRVNFPSESFMENLKCTKQKMSVDFCIITRIIRTYKVLKSPVTASSLSHGGTAAHLSPAPLFPAVGLHQHNIQKQRISSCNRFAYAYGKGWEQKAKLWPGPTCMQCSLLWCTRRD